MSQLPPELTRIPPASLDVLRFMGRASLDSATADVLAEGTNMSDRAIGKAIRGLVTKGYLNMDSTYTYFLTDKGIQAISDIAEYDDAHEGEGESNGAASEVSCALVVVAPEALGGQQSATARIGLNSAPAISESTQLILRFAGLGADVNPKQATLDLNPGQLPAPFQVQIVPSGEYGAARVRVEVMQLVSDTEIHQAGGLFFDLPLGNPTGNWLSWYGEISLQA